MCWYQRVRNGRPWLPSYWLAMHEQAGNVSMFLLAWLSWQWYRLYKIKMSCPAWSTQHGDGLLYDQLLHVSSQTLKMKTEPELATEPGPKSKTGQNVFCSNPHSNINRMSLDLILFDYVFDAFDEVKHATCATISPKRRNLSMKCARNRKNETIFAKRSI